MDEALKALAASQVTDTGPPIRYAGVIEHILAQPEIEEAPVATQSKYTKLKSWFILHKKVQSAAIALIGVTYAAFDQAYNSNHDYTSAAKIAGGAALVWLFAYGKKA